MRNTTIVLVVFVLSGCNQNPPCIICPSLKRSDLRIDSIVVESTEIDLKISTKDSTVLGNISLSRNDSIIFSGRVSRKDSLINNTSLLPSHQYVFTAHRMVDQNNFKTDDVQTLAIRTMDTSSHNYFWQIDTVGVGYTSLAWDVAIINDNLAYVVGTFYLYDSSGHVQDVPKGVAEWDGNNWQFQHLYAINLSGGQSTLEPRTLFAFSAGDIWLAEGSVFHWDGGSEEVTPYWIAATPGNPSPVLLPGQTIEKIWGTSSSDLYLVGRQGAIVHFNGRSWQRMESGTTTDLTDVWGSPDGKVIWACGYSDCCPGTILLRYRPSLDPGWQKVVDGGSLETVVRSDSLSGTFVSLFTQSDERLYVGSSAGMYKTLSSSVGKATRISYTSGFFDGLPSRMRGPMTNDLAIVGAYGFIAHYNGISIKYYSGFYNNNILFNSVAIKDNLIIAVGYLYDPINSKGVVYIGRR